MTQQQISFSSYKILMDALEQAVLTGETQTLWFGYLKWGYVTPNGNVILA